MPASRKHRVLFVCIGNACRSPMAEAITRHHAFELIEPSSAGFSPLGHLTQLTKQTLLANGYSIGRLSSKPLTRQALVNADLVVNISGESLDRYLNSAAAAGFQSGPEVENWNVEDPYGQDPAIYQRILEELESRVLLLAGRLRAGKHTVNP